MFNAANSTTLRDVIVPDGFEVKGGARLPWLWWGLDGHDELAVAEADAQLSRHAGPFGAALESMDALTAQRVAFAVDSTLLLAGLSAVLAPAATILSAARLASQAPRVFQSKRSRLHAALRVDAKRRFSARDDAISAAASDGRLLAQLTRWVPLVAVVDHAESLDPTTLALLGGLVRSSASRVLVVFATDIDRAENSALDKFLEGLDDRVVERVEIDPFTDAQLASICAATFDQLQPGCDLDSAGASAVVSTADGAPGALANLLSHRSVLEALSSRASLPPNLRTLAIRSREEDSWAALPTPARVALAALAIHGPRTLAALVDPAIARFALETGWVASLTGGSTTGGELAFRGPVLFETTRGHIDDTLSHEERTAESRRVEAGLMAIAETGMWDEVPVDVALDLLQHMADTDAAMPPTLQAALLRLRRAAGLREVDRARLEEILERGANGELLLATAEALADAGWAHRSVDLYTRELARAEENYGRGDPRTLSPLHNLAASTAAYARSLSPTERTAAYEQAFQLYVRLIYGYQQHATTSRRLPDTRAELAALYQSVGRFADGYTTLLPAIAEYSQALGPDRPDTLASRSNLAMLHARAGDLGAALAEMKELAPTMARVLGREHPGTLTNRSNLAAALALAGDPGGALADLKELVPVKARVLGVEHPDTLTTRMKLAATLALTRDSDSALTILEELIPVMVRVLGADDLDTLLARNNRAGARVYSGDAVGAVAELEELIPVMVRVLGAEYPQVLTARNNIANARTIVGDATGALAELRELIPVMVRVLGAEHPDTVTARINLTTARNAAGDATGALTDLDALIPTAIRVLGAEHPNTRVAWSNLATARRALDESGC
ncbi:tetratricopeptide repeat protein [Agromyces allii]|uniref:Tetratricopeptide repeat protein n=1 Tax=Agromyces allii TaxID=393607 RepID=A0ABN2Q555_9MICO|nr:tetratricopeptide repeat protein [Agromyces allii]